MRPFPSKKGWIVSANNSPTCSEAGGTNGAVVSVSFPAPTQTGPRRDSPGFRSTPRTPSIRTAWTSLKVILHLGDDERPH